MLWVTWSWSILCGQTGIQYGSKMIEAVSGLLLSNQTHQDAENACLLLFCYNLKLYKDCPVLRD